MTNFTFNVAKGMVGYYATLPGVNDALIAVPIMTTGMESDATLIEYTTLAALLGSSNDEQTTLNRKTLTSVTSTADSTTNTRIVDVADFTWTAGSGSPIAAIIVCYVPDIGAGYSDTTVIPLTKHDFSVIPSGSDIPVQISTHGVYVASDATQIA